MKTKITIKLGMLAVFASLSMNCALAQNSTGNGGGGLYCPGATGAELKFEAYDLYEAKNPIDPRNRLEIKDWDGVTTKEQYLTQAIEKVRLESPATAAGLIRILDFMKSRIQDSGDRELELVADVQMLMKKRGCKYYQLVNWVDGDSKEFYELKDEVVLRDEIAYQQMNPLNQAANDFHEAVYKMRRSMFGSDGKPSMHVRKFVAQVFSISPINPQSLRKISRYEDFATAESDELQKFWVNVFSNEFCSSNELAKSAVTLKTKDGSIVSVYKQDTGSYSYPNRGVVVSSGSAVTFSMALSSDSIARVAFLVGRESNYNGAVPLEITIKTCGKTVTNQILIKRGYELLIGAIRPKI